MVLAEPGQSTGTSEYQPLPTLAGLSAGQCTYKADLQRLKSFLKTSPEVETVIFFASWCGACIDKLTAATPDSLLVAIFDTPTDANRAYLETNRGRNLCMIDKDASIVDGLKIYGLPYQLSRKDILSPS